MDEGRRWRPFGPSSPLRSFALGGVIGAAGTIATVRRLRRTSHRSRAAAGLSAFEDAPCFREIVELEGYGYGEPASGGTSAEGG
jgi:hypothetical protein